MNFIKYGYTVYRQRVAPHVAYLVYLIVPLVCVLAYTGLLKAGDSPSDLSPHLNYFRELAYAFLHGQLNIDNPPFNWDLVIYKQKYYVYWPPVPALVYMPLVAVFGINLPDSLISSLFGMLNVWLLMKVCQKLSQRFSLGLEPKHIFWIGIFWGLGTVHFYMSKAGYVWFVSQVLAQTFLLASVYVLLAKPHKTASLIGSGLCFALAVYTRNHLVFSAFFFLFLYRALHPAIRLKELIKPAVTFLLPFILFTFLNLWYNYARFGNVFENGIKYHNMGPHFFDNFNQHGYFSLHYIPYNFYVEVIHFPTLLPYPPFIQNEPEGFGFIWGSPLFLLLIPAFFFWLKNNLLKRQGSGTTALIKAGSIAAALPIALVIFTIMGTGWAQFCARYTLDFQFFLIVFLIFSMKDLAAIPLLKPVSLFLILLSVAIQYIGAWYSG